MDNETQQSDTERNEDDYIWLGAGEIAAYEYSSDGTCRAIPNPVYSPALARWVRRNSDWLPILRDKPAP